MRAPETHYSLSKSRISLFNAHLALYLSEIISICIVHYNFLEEYAAIEHKLADTEATWHLVN